MESVLNILSYVFWVILAIMILVFVHEMGHFLFAKLFKMRVEKFSIGFPPRIIGRKFGETEYVVGATPLGGYVKISGMVDESMDTDMLESEPQPWEFRAKPVWQRMIVITAGVIFNILLSIFIFSSLRLTYGEDYIPIENIKSVYIEDGSFFHKMGLRTGDRILAISGKPLERYNDLLNLEDLLADPMTVTVLRNRDTMTFRGPHDIMTQLNRAQTEGMGLGISPLPSIVGSIRDKSPAAVAGLQPGDRIVEINGRPVHFWNELVYLIRGSKGQPLVVKWQRPDSLVADASPSAPMDAPAPVSSPDSTLEAEATGDAAGLPVPAVGAGAYRVLQTRVTPESDDKGDYVIGIGAATEEMLVHEFGARHEDYSIGAAIAGGARETWVNVAAIVTSLKRMVTGRENLRENLGGPIMIAKVTKQAAASGARDFWNIVALLSLTLAVMNILPIPALDGGHLVFLLYEGITRREPSLKVRMALQQIGMVVLLALMTFLVFNDILKL